MTNVCCCHGVEGAPSPDCYGVFESDAPHRFIGEPICPPCYEELCRTLKSLKGKGVTLIVDYGDEGATDV